MKKNIASYKKMTKILMLLLPLLGLYGISNDANAYARYMVSTGAPSCGVCHWVTKEHGLEIQKKFIIDEVTGKKSLYKAGPYSSWKEPQRDARGKVVRDENGSIIMERWSSSRKMDQFCNAKLKKALRKLQQTDPTAIAGSEWDDSKNSYKCVLTVE